MISVNNSKADTALHAHLASRDDPHDAIVPAMAGAFLALAFSLAVGPPCSSPPISLARERAYLNPRK
jgi:hypothetical protein